jgi:putative membrane protein
MQVPGISTTVEGLDTISAGLGEGLDEADLGKATVDRMKQAADEYDTFLGKPDGASGDVRFIFRLDGIDGEE